MEEGVIILLYALLVAPLCRVKGVDFGDSLGVFLFVFLLCVLGNLKKKALRE